VDIKQFASLGGKARAKALNARQRKAAAKKAIKARWAKRKTKAA
jgi:hypothetical protein